MGGYHVCKGRVEDRPCLSVFFLYFLNLSLGIIPLHPSQARLILGSMPGGTRVRIHCACTSKRCMPLDSRHSMWQLISRLQTRCSKKERKKGEGSSSLGIEVATCVHQGKRIAQRHLECCRPSTRTGRGALFSRKQHNERTVKGKKRETYMRKLLWE